MTISIERFQRAASSYVSSRSVLTDFIRERLAEDATPKQRQECLTQCALAVHKHTGDTGLRSALNMAARLATKGKVGIGFTPVKSADGRQRGWTAYFNNDLTRRKASKVRKAYCRENLVAYAESLARDGNDDVLIGLQMELEAASIALARIINGDDSDDVEESEAA